MRSSCSEGLLSSDHGFDTIVHILDELNLVSTESSHVGDIEDTIVSLGVLTVDSSDLDKVLVGDSLELLFNFAKERKLDVHRGSQGSSAIGRTRSDVAQVVVMGKLSCALQSRGSSGQAREHGTDVRALLHRDDTQLVLFVDPYEEALGIVMEDASSGGPVSVESSRLKESVTLFEKEVVVDELLLVSLRHAGKWIVRTLKITSQS